MFNPVPPNPMDEQNPPQTDNEGRPETNNDEQGSIPDEAYVYAFEQLTKGRKPREVRKSLLDAGYSLEQTEEIMNFALTYGRRTGTFAELAKERDWNQGMGFILIMAGILLSVGSYMLAGPGGTYVVTSGLFITGFVMLMRGGLGSNRNDSRT
jgi:hypothetical protein